MPQNNKMIKKKRTSNKPNEISEYIYYVSIKEKWYVKVSIFDSLGFTNPWRMEKQARKLLFKEEVMFTFRCNIT